MYKLLLLIILTSCEKVSLKGFNISNRKRAVWSNAILVCDGNSLTYGTGSSNLSTKPFPALLDADSAFNGTTVYNFGVPAQTTAQMSSDAVSQVDSLYDSAKSNVVIAWEVGNDIFYNGNATTAVSTFWTYCDNRRSAGWRVVVITCPPRDQATDFGDNSAQYNVKLTDANALLRSQFTSHADGIIDLASDSRFSGYNLTYYDADKIHYTDAGYQVVKDLVKAKLLEL